MPRIAATTVHKLPGMFGHAVRRNLAAYMFLLPAIVLFLMFSWYPIINGFIISFQSIDLISGVNSFVGLNNFRVVLSDSLFYKAVGNTMYFVFLGLLIGYLLPVILAIMVNEMHHGKSYFRLAFYLPVILPPMVSVLLWKWFYDPGMGLMNIFLGAIGVGPSEWIYSADTAMPSLVLMSTWANVGGTMLLYLAALQGVPASLYESAELEGASVFQRIAHITLPGIRGVMAIMFLLQIIGTIQVFTEPFVMTDGGPAYSTLTVMQILYNYAFRFYDFGSASAVGLLLFIVLAFFSILYMRVSRVNNAEGN